MGDALRAKCGAQMRVEVRRPGGPAAAAAAAGAAGAGAAGAAGGAGGSGGQQLVVGAAAAGAAAGALVEAPEEEAGGILLEVGLCAALASPQCLLWARASWRGRRAEYFLRWIVSSWRLSVRQQPYLDTYTCMLYVPLCFTHSWCCWTESCSKSVEATRGRCRWTSCAAAPSSATTRWVHVC